MVFWSFWVLGPILEHPTAKFELSGQFCFSRHPLGPWGCQSSGDICIWKIYQLFFDSGAALADFFTFMKVLANVSFISIRIPKSSLKARFFLTLGLGHQIFFWKFSPKLKFENFDEFWYFMNAHFGTLTQCSVEPSVPVLLTAKPLETFQKPNFW